jgi:hypothetical protein
MARVSHARPVACLSVWRKDQLPDEERAYLQRLCDQEPTIALAYELAQGFFTMACERSGEGFDAWLTRATTSGIPELDSVRAWLDGRSRGGQAGLSQE